MCIKFLFSSRRQNTSWPRDWSSDVCSSDLVRAVLVGSTSSPYLSTTLAALAAQTRQAGEVIIASLDAQSSATDQRWQELLTESGLDPAAVRIVPVPHAATFGGAVRRALRSLDGETPPSAPEG